MKLILKGSRINLRTLKMSDATSLQKYANDRTVGRFIPHFPYPYRLRHAEKFIKGTWKKLHDKTYYELGIEYKATGEIIGMMSITKVDRQNKNAEIGYWLAKSYRGKGIGNEALIMALDYAFKKLKMKRLYIKCFHVNKASAALAKSAGFKYEGSSRSSCFRYGKWYDDLHFGLLKEEYKH